MSGKPVETINLNNGIVVEIWDHSRVLAGDRWLVSLEARADIPLDMTQLPALEDEDKEKVFQALKKAYSDKIPYRYRQEKHFVDQRERDRIFREFLDLLKSNVLPYLSHKEFARKLVLVKVRELKRKDPRLFF